MPTEYETYASMARQAVPQDKLLGQLMDSTFYKTDREHAAVREILRLQGEVEGADVLHEVEKRIVATFDDRNRVVAMWRDAGIPCFQVAPGEF